MKEFKSKVLTSPMNNQQEYCKKISECTVTIQQDPLKAIYELHKHRDMLTEVESTTENSLKHWQEQIWKTSNKEIDHKPQTYIRYQYFVNLN